MFLASKPEIESHQKTRDIKLVIKLNKKISRIITKNNLEVNFQINDYDVICKNKIVEVVLTSTKANCKVSQLSIISVAEVIIRNTPRNLDVKIYSKIGDDFPILELSLNEETEKHYSTFDRIERVVTLKDETLKRNRKRIATLNVLRRERISKVLGEEVGEEELKRRQLYLEERIADLDSFQKMFTFISVLLFGGSSVLFSSFNVNKIPTTSPDKSNKVQVSQTNSVGNDNRLEKIGLLFVGAIFVLVEYSTIQESTKKKGYLSIVKYALELSKK